MFGVQDYFMQKVYFLTAWIEPPKTPHKHTKNTQNQNAACLIKQKEGAKGSKLSFWGRDLKAVGVPLSFLGI